jgi:hypothetical protein
MARKKEEIYGLIKCEKKARKELSDAKVACMSFHGLTLTCRILKGRF